MSMRAARALAACLALGLGLLVAPCGADGAACDADGAACDDAAGLELVMTALGQELAADGLELRQLRAEKQSAPPASREALGATLDDIGRQEVALGRAREEVQAQISRLESKKYETSAESDVGGLQCGDVYCSGERGSHCCWGKASGDPYAICCGGSGLCKTGVTGLAMCLAKHQPAWYKHESHHHSHH